ncbi:hypothetical protein Tco_0733073 [Tanacetum coccineum]
MILYSSKEKKVEAETEIVNVADSTDSDDLDTQPLSKKFKISPSISDVIKPTPLSSILPEHPIIDPSKGKKLKLSPATIKAQELKWQEHEAKKAKMLDDYMSIFTRSNNLPITKISYTIDAHKIPTMRIIRDNVSLNLTSLKDKFQWVINHAKKVGLPPPPELATLGMTTEEKKQKRTEFQKEMFTTKDNQIDGMNRNLTPPTGIIPIDGLVIAEPESGIFFMNTNVAFQRESEFHLTPTVQLIRIQNQIKIDSEVAKEMVSKMNFVIEARDDCSEARKIVEQNLQNLG